MNTHAGSKPVKTHLPVVALVASALIGISAQATSTQASSIAAGVTRTRIANIDVVVDRTGVKEDEAVGCAGG